MSRKQNDLLQSEINDALKDSKPASMAESDKESNQTRSVGMMKRSSDFDRIEHEDQFTKMSSNPCHGGGSRQSRKGG